MRKVKLALSLYSGKVVYLSIPIITLSGLKTPEKILKIVSYLSLLTLGIWLFLFGIVLKFSDRYTEYIWFVYVIWGMLAVFGFYLISVILGGVKKLIDPKGFLVVLIFSLATTTASISITPPDIANTFGMPSMKGLSGLVIMASLGMFYLVNVYVFNSSRLKFLIKFLVAGIGAFVLYILLAAEAEEVYVLILLITLPITLGALHYSKRYNWILLLQFITQIILILKFGFFDNNSGIQDLSLVVTLPLLISVLVLQSIYVSVEWQSMQKKLAGLNSLTINLRKGFSDNFTLQKTVSFLTNILVPLASVVLLGFIVYLLLTDYSLKAMYDKCYESLDYSLRYITTPIGDKFNWDNFKILTMGGGARKVTYGNTFVSNLVGMQGLVGVFAYLLIWSYGIWNGLVLFKTLIRKNKNLGSLLAGFFVILLYIPLLGFFVYPTIGAVILWWFSFSLIIAVRQFTEAKSVRVYTDNDFEVKTINFRRKDWGKWGIYFKYFVCVLIVGLIVFFGYSFLEVLRDLK